MKQRPYFLILMALLIMTSCSPKESQEVAPKSSEALALKSFLKSIPDQGVLFGHQDDPVYGVEWCGDEDRSDVKAVCGDYPAVMGFDLGGLELGNSVNLDSVPFDRMRQEIVAHHNRGGIVTISWHAYNPLTGGNSWDVSDSTVVRQSLQDSEVREVMTTWLDRVADFLNSLQTEEGKYVPVLFRPWHEHTGNWFWWGQDFCSAEEYKALWQMTYDHLQEKGVRHLLYSYSPGADVRDLTHYLERYPEGDIVDLVGVDGYQFERDHYVSEMKHAIDILHEVADQKDVAIAITETGFEGLGDSLWWSETLLPIVKKSGVSYLLVWRNAHNKPGHFYAPYPGHESAEDFLRFYQDESTLFVQDIKPLKK